MNSYEMKQEARRQQLERRAAALREGATARFQSARSSLDGIEPGQPILVGHHSEKRHRRALERHDQRMRKAIELDAAAAELARKADAVGSGGISSDDPDATAKLREKLAGMVRERDQMKAVNAAWRVKDPAKRQTALLALGLSEATIVRLANDIERFHHWDRQPFAKWALSNLGANIRRAEQRIATLERLATLRAAEPAGATTPATVSDIATITADVDDNRVLVTFPARLTRDSYKAMRSMGFLWSPSRGGFVRKLTGCSIANAAAIVARLNIHFEEAR